MPLEFAAEPDALGGAEAARREILAFYFSEDRIVPADFGPYRPEYFQEQPGPVFRRTSVCVGTVIVKTGEKLADQVAVGGVKLHAVEPGPFGPERGFGKAPDNMGNLPGRCLPAGRPVPAGDEGRRPDGGSGIRRRPSGVGELKHDFCAGSVDAIHRFAPRADAAVGIGGGLIPAGAPFGRNERVPGDDKPEPGAAEPFVNGRKSRRINVFPGCEPFVGGGPNAPLRMKIPTQPDMEGNE